MRMLKENSDTRPTPDQEGRLNLEKLIKEEFIKKMESLYIKQLMMANISDRSMKEQSLNDIEDSLNQHTFTEDHHYFEKEGASANFD